MSLAFWIKNYFKTRKADYIHPFLLQGDIDLSIWDKKTRRTKR